MRTIVLLFLLLAYKEAFTGIALGGKIGSPISSEPEFNYSIFLYNKFDEQVLLGVNSGQQYGGIPILASGYIRLPFGKIFMPVAAGDAGYFLHDDNDGFIWRAGGGIDWKNGTRSSILLLGGYEQFPDNANPYGRIGLMLEF